MKKKEEFVGFSRHEYCPMVRPKTEELLKMLLQEHKPKNILEIGTFLGYSACVMLETAEDVHVTTLEKDPQNFADATENLKEYGDRVQILCCDAMNFLKETSAAIGSQSDCVEESQKLSLKPFDFIFLDGPKGQYVQYLPHLKQLLRAGGVLLCDDILFYGLVQADGKIAHKHRSIVNNLRKFLETLQNDSDFETKIYCFEDGVSVSKKKA